MKRPDKRLLRFGAVLVLIFAILICATAQRPTQKQSPRHAVAANTADAAREPAALAFTLRLPWPQIYSGDPLYLQGSIESPHAIAEEFKQLYLLEQGTTPPPASFTPPAIAADWYTSVKLTLYRLNSKGVKEQIMTGDWKEYLISDPAGELLSSPDASSPVDWLIAAESVRLTEGRYQLEGIWNGKNRVEPALLDSKGMLKTESIVFTVITPTSAMENGIHLQHLAEAAYLSKQYESAIKYGQEAIARLGNLIRPETAELYFTVSNAQIYLKNYTGAISTLEELLGRLPDQDNEMGFIIKQRINTLAKLQQ